MRAPLSIRFKTSPSPWGNLLLAASPEGLCGTWFEAQKHFPNTTDWQLDAQHPVLVKAEHLLNDYIKGQAIEQGLADFAKHGLPLDLTAGTDFQQSVWQALMRIPYGQTCTYGELAKALGKPNAVRAVGTAIGRNPLSILIPCHRVLGANGQMTGYAGGIWRKVALLQREASSK